MIVPINNVSSEELKDTNRFKPVDFKSHMPKAKLHTSLCIPSYTQAYSVCLNYVKNWFLRAMPKDYFKSIYIDGKHAFAEFKDKNINQLAKKPKPSLAIVPQFDYNFDNEDLNWQFGNKHVSTRITHGMDIFFSDKQKNLHIAFAPQLLSANIMFKIKVNTKAKQMDLFKYMSLALGDHSATHGMYIQLDYDIPDELVLQLAKDANFEIIDGKIKDNMAFLAYVNKHSKIPFLFKLRNINGKRSYFIRPVTYVHLREPDDINLDDGERQGQVTSNFILEYELQVRFPAVHFFKYLSLTPHENIKVVDEDGNIKAVYSDFSMIPTTNSQGWEIYLETDYEETNIKEPLKIEFKELFENTDLGLVIKSTTDKFLSPAGFVDVHLYNADRDVPLNIDWKNMVITTVGLALAERSRLVFYVDKQFVNQEINNLKGFQKTRINTAPEEYKK